MNFSMDQTPLYRIANPRSIAFFGASNNITAMGTNQLLSLLELGFEGPIYPIHPQESTVQGLPAYKNVQDLPEVPDLAVLVLPTKIVVEILMQCGKKGIRHAIVVSGGFKEVGERGAELEKSLLSVAREYGIRVLGPNCIGVANPYHKLNTTFLPYLGEPGFIGMASQSGSFVTQMFDYLCRHGLGFSTAFSVGNEADIDLVDCMEYLGACPHTRVIALYIEGLRRGREFVRVAGTITCRKPIVALYVGGSEAGKRAGLSHTGAMAGPDRLYEGVFRQSGVIRARSVTEVFDFCWALGTLPRPKGQRVLIQTHSGGPGAAAADAVGRVGLDLLPLSHETMERLKPLLPHTGSTNNPVDFTFIRNPLHYFSEIPDILLQEKRADILLVYLLFPSKSVKRALEMMGLSEKRAGEESRKMIDTQCEALARLVKKHGKPILGYTFRSMGETLIRGLVQRGIPVFGDPTRAARAIHAMVEKDRFRRQATQTFTSHTDATAE